MVLAILYHIARQVIAPLQWLSEDEERQVMELVNRLLWEKRHPRGNQRG